MSAFDNIASKSLNKTKDKVETNWRQTGDKTKDKVETNWRQNRDKTGDKIKNWRQSRDATRDKTRDKFTFQELLGIQRILMIYIFNSCVQKLSHTSGKISIQNLCDATKTSPASVKKSINRLQEKKLITRGEFKNGRGGWTRYIINKSAHQEMTYLSSKDTLTRDETRDKLETQLETNASSSSSNIYNNKNTTTNEYEIFKKIINEIINEINDDELKKVITDTEINNILNYRNQELNEDELRESLLDFIHDYNIAKADEKALGCNSIQLIGRFVSKMRNGYYSSNKARQARLEIQKKEKEELERYLNEKRKLIRETNENKFKAWLLSNDSNDAKHSFSGFC